MEQLVDLAAIWVAFQIILSVIMLPFVLYIFYKVFKGFREF